MKIEKRLFKFLNSKLLKKWEDYRIIKHSIYVFDHL